MISMDYAFLSLRASAPRSSAFVLCVLHARYPLHLYVCKDLFTFTRSRTVFAHPPCGVTPSLSCLDTSVRLRVHSLSSPHLWSLSAVAFYHPALYCPPSVRSSLQFGCMCEFGCMCAFQSQPERGRAS